MNDEPLISQQAQGSYIAQVVLPPPAIQEQNRVRFLARLRFQYDELWEQSLQGVALITLGLTEKPDAVLHHAELLLHVPPPPERSLPEGTSITDVYDQSGQGLLILGEPGAGKSTLLLGLARQLVERAERDPVLPLPVILPLSSWAVKQPPFTEWLAAQLSLIYDVPFRLSRAWVQTNQVLPLLDGLNEVSLAYREACVAAITSYHVEHLTSIVVSSRTAEYFGLSKRLPLNNAVIVQPLTPQQASAYLASMGVSTMAFRSNLVLEELATTPLLLNLLLLNLQVTSSIEDLLAVGSPNVRTLQRRFFASYVQGAFRRGPFNADYPPQLAIRWLAWLAQQLVRSNQTVFYIEQIQPTWLPEGRLQHLHHRITRIGFEGLVIGLTVGLIGGLAGGLVVGLASGFVGGLVGGASCYFVYDRRGTIKPAETIVWSWVRARQNTVVLLMASLAIEVSILSLGWFKPSLFNGIAFGLIGGLVGGASCYFVYDRRGTIKPTEIIIWSWAQVRQIIVVSLMASLVIGVSILSLSWSKLGLFYGISFGLISTLLPLLFLVLIGGSRSETFDYHRHIIPNEGILRSARNGLLLGLPCGALCGLLVGLFLGLLRGISTGLSGGLVIGVLVGMLVWIFNGGRAWVEHFILRALLRYAGYAPWNYSRFLDYATDHTILRKVGGGYIFQHRLLFEYFSNLDIVSVPFAKMRRERTRSQKRNRRAQIS